MQTNKNEIVKKYDAGKLLTSISKHLIYDIYFDYTLAVAFTVSNNCSIYNL